MILVGKYDKIRSIISRIDRDVEMKNKIFALLLTVIIAFSCVGCTRSENVSTPAFWKISGNGFDGDFYMLGSIHVGDEDTNTYPEEIIDAFEECDYLAVESDVLEIEKDATVQVEMLQSIKYADGSTIKDHIDYTLYENACKILKEYNIYNSAIDMCQPIYWVSLIENAYISKTKYSAELGVDRYFLNKAKKDGKPILEIENPVKTYEALGQLNPETQEYLLKQATDPLYSVQSSIGIEMLYSIWKKGNTDTYQALSSNSDAGISEEESKMNEEYNNMMLGERNKKMIDTAVAYLETDKDVFYVVGFAHMVGQDNIIDALKNMGYSVTRVEYSK